MSFESLAVSKAPRSRTDLFLSFTWLGLQGFGGVLAVVQREIVDRKQWMTLSEFAELSLIHISEPTRPY